MNGATQLPAVQNLEFESDTDFSVNLTLLDAFGNPINLTGCTMTADIKKTNQTSTVAASFTATLVDATAGMITLSLPAASNTLTSGANATDPAGQYVWDLKVVTTGGAVSRPIGGTVTIIGSVTP